VTVALQSFNFQILIGHAGLVSTHQPSLSKSSDMTAWAAENVAKELGGL